MKRPAYSPQAKQDLRDIAVYLSDRNPAAARRFFARLRERCRLLANRPGLGPLQPKLGAGVRVSALLPYAVYFRATHGGIRVERVIHGARDIEFLFGGDRSEEE